METSDPQFPFVFASLHSVWDNGEQSRWEDAARKALSPIGNGAAGKRGTVNGVKVRNRKWNYDLLIYADGEQHSSGRISYAQLFERFLSPTGWQQTFGKNGIVKHIMPLAPGFGEKVKKDLADMLSKELVDGLASIAGKTSPYRSVYACLQHIGAQAVKKIHEALIGGISPLYARDLSPVTQEMRRKKGHSSNKPMNETGEMINHVHWAIRGWEKEEMGDIAFGTSKNVTFCPGIVDLSTRAPARQYIKDEVARNNTPDAQKMASRGFVEDVAKLIARGQSPLTAALKAAVAVR